MFGAHPLEIQGKKQREKEFVYNLPTTLFAYNLAEYARSFFLHGFRVMRVKILRNCRIFVTEAGGNVNGFSPASISPCSGMLRVMLYSMRCLLHTGTGRRCVKNDRFVYALRSGGDSLPLSLQMA